MIKIRVCLDEDTLRKLETLAKRLNVTRSEVMRRAIDIMYEYGVKVGRGISLAPKGKKRIRTLVAQFDSTVDRVWYYLSEMGPIVSMINLDRKLKEREGLKSKSLQTIRRAIEKLIQEGIVKRDINSNRLIVIEPHPEVRSTLRGYLNVSPEGYL